MVDQIVVMSVKALFPNDQGEVKNILRENNRNTEKQLEQRRQKKWKKFITCQMKTQMKNNRAYPNH